MTEIQTARVEEAKKPERDLTDLTRQVDELIPILAHGFTQEIEDRGLRGKIQLHAVAGDEWSVGMTQDNVYGVPNVITYPEGYLAKTDLRVVNARLRHEIGNLNYPFERYLSELSSWAKDQDLPPQIATALAQAIHSPSVDYLEMKNSHSSTPQDNFRALYETEINVREMVASIGDRSPFRQAIDITFLEGLSRIGIIASEIVEEALTKSSLKVKEAITPELRDQINDAVKTSNPRRKASTIKDGIFPQLVSLISPEELEAMNRTLQDSDTNVEQSSVKHGEEISPQERIERIQAENLLAEALNDRLTEIQKRLEKAQARPASPKEQKLSSMQEIAQQASQMQEQMQETLQQKTDGEQVKNELQNLKEELEQLQEVANQFSEADLEKAVAEEDEEPMTYNITEFGIDESKLTPEQLETLENVREFAKNTSKTYRSVMRLLMNAYQQYNPNFTDKIIGQMKDHGYDLPSFSIYSQQAATEFLGRQDGLGIDSLLNQDSFLVNFNLPKPIGRFWYRGGSGSKSIPVPPGAIEWGEFYRRSMPVIWNATDRAPFAEQIYLDRLNQFGQHDPKNFYYLWEASKIELPDNQGQLEGESAQENQDRQDGDQPEGQHSENGNLDQQSGQSTEAGMMAEQSADNGSKDQSSDRMGQSNQTSDQPNGQSQIQQDSLADSQSDQLSQMAEGNLQPGQDIQAGTQEQPGGVGQNEGQGVQYSRRNRMLDELNELNDTLGSKFGERNEEGNFGLKKTDEEVAQQLIQQQKDRLILSQRAQIAELEKVKQSQENDLRSYYQELSGLDGEALDTYVEYMEDVHEFIDEATDFFTERFNLDQEYQVTKDQLHGSRLQNAWQRNILGTLEGKTVLRPNSFERKLNPEKPTFCWSIILDNTGSTAGGVIQAEKKLAVGLVELTKRLDIPFEVLIFTEGGYRFLKTFDQDISGEDLAKVVLLDASICNQNDELILTAACQSLQNYADQFTHSYNFVFFLTDGMVCEGSIPGVINNFRRDMVITGIGLQSGADTIHEHFGPNAIPVPRAEQLSQRFFDKIEQQIDDTFD